MGLRATSTSVSSSSASKIIPPDQQIVYVSEEYSEKGLLTNKKKERNSIRGLEQDLKVISNVSIQSNMAPAVTEPLSPANKLSSSGTSTSPRPLPLPNSQLTNSNYLSTNANSEHNRDIIDIESELLRSAEVSITSGINGGRIKAVRSNGIYSDCISVNRTTPKGAFLVLEKVIAGKQATTEDTTSDYNCNTDSTENQKNKSSLVSKGSNISRRAIFCQMGPMCDTNNSTKSELIETESEKGESEYQRTTASSITTDGRRCDITEETLDEGLENKKEKETQHMDLSSYDDNEDSQQDNVQAEIKSTSSTITAENTDGEDNIPLTENPDQVNDAEIEKTPLLEPEQESSTSDLNTISTSQSEEPLLQTLTHSQTQITSICSLTPLLAPEQESSTSDLNTISTSQSEEPLLQTETHNQTQITSICSLTPQSTTSAGGLSQKDFSKESAEMDQVLGDMDLLQVLKGFDSAPGSENLCDLAGSLGLFNDVDVMNYEEMGVSVKDSETREIRNDIERRQQQMQRKFDFLFRRLRKIQARFMGKHVSEEVAGLLEWTNRIIRRKDYDQSRQILYEEDKRRPVSTASMRLFLKRLDTVATAQHSNSSRSNKMERSHPTSTVTSELKTKKTETSPIITTFDEKTTETIELVSGMLQTELKEVQSGIDSDVTASSSGGESADEMVTYNNQMQQSLSIAKRAAWRWARDRAAIASRWTWLLTQISDLDTRIRRHNDVYNQFKNNKGAVKLEKLNVTCPTSSPPLMQTSSVNGYRGTLSESSKSLDIESSPPNGAYESNNLPGACRTRPFQKAIFRKRKLLQMANLHTASKRTARTSTIKCGCQTPFHPCGLCTGRMDPTAPRDLPDTMTFSEKVALLDPGFHAVLSFPEDVATNIHFEGIARLPEWQNRVIRSPSKTILKGAVAAATQKAAEREDRSKKLLDSRRKQSRKNAQETGPANKIKNAKARRALHGSQFNNAHPQQKHNKNSKHRKSSLSAGGAMSGDYHESGVFIAGSVGTNSSSGVTGSSDGGMDNNDFGSNGGGGNHVSRSKNSSPTLGNHGYLYKSERCDRKNRNSYDIDNIVIPYSVAAATRVEILPYKEIPTPKWRIIEDDVPEQQNIELKSTEDEETEDKELEDLSDFAVRIRHERALLEERKKFQTFLKFPWSTRSRANRRIDSRAESSGANTPDPTSPASNTQNTVGEESIPSPANPSTPQTPAEPVEGGDNLNFQNSVAMLFNLSHRKGERRRTVSSKKDSFKEDYRSCSPDTRDIVPPFEPLEFPLPDQIYESMLRMMPNNHQLIEDCSKILNCDRISKDNTSENDGSSDTNKNKSESGGNNGNNSINRENSIICIKDGEGGSKLRYSNINAATIPIPQYNNSTTDGYFNSKFRNNLLTAFETGDSLMGCDSDTDSAESGMQDDPNDPEWQEPVK